MADDWQAGDLALCVNASRMENARYISHGKGLRKGAVYTVAQVGFDPDDGEPLLFLRDDGADAKQEGRLRCRFRKIRHHTPDAEDAETIRLLRGAPVRVDA